MRREIDDIDSRMLDLLSRRRDLVDQVTQNKLKEKIPVYVSAREDEKVKRFRDQAVEKGLDPEWAEDFLRMIFGSSRARQSDSTFPMAGDSPKTILYVGGDGGMGRLYQTMSTRSGHHVRCLDKNDWDRADELIRGADAVIITVPINHTANVIRKIGPMLSKDQILADFTSLKSAYLNLMQEYHDGPVLGLHPMHGPDVPNLSKQVMIVCEGEHSKSTKWLLDQFRLWGMRIKKVNAEQHDRSMHLIQGLRHFIALLHGSFMNRHDLRPEDMLDFSSPIYRAELMMTGRIFAQDAELYADIVLSDEERTSLLSDFLEHHKALSDMISGGDKEAFIKEFEEVSDFFGNFAPQALKESGYLINRLADRFG